MAEENQNQEQTLVTVKYVGTGGPASGIADYREDGSGKVESGDTVDVPAEVAASIVLNADWQYANAEDVPEEGVEVDKREDPNSGKSPADGLTAEDQHTDKSYDQVVVEREKEHGVNAPNSDQESKVWTRLAEIREEETPAEAEGEAGDGDPDGEQEEEVNE